MWTAILTFLSPAWTWFKGVFSRHALVVLLSIACVILLLLLDFSNGKKNKEIAALKVSNANFMALNDTIRTTAAKDKAVEYDKYLYLANNVNDLKKTNDSLYKAIKNTKGTVIAAAITGTKLVDSGNLRVKVIHDTNTITNTIVISTIDVSLDTVYKPGNYHKMETLVYVQDTSHITSVLKRDEIGFTATTGLKKDEKGNYTIFVRPDYPGATITRLDGAIVDPKVFATPSKGSKFSLGLHIGYDPFYYDFDAHKLGIKNQIAAGVGIGFKIF